MTVGSKWGYTYTAGWQVDMATQESRTCPSSTLRRQIGETRGLLGERLALYQIHSATVESGVLEDAAVHEALAELRAEGVSIGLTTTGPGRAQTVDAAALAAARHGPVDLEPARALGRHGAREAHGQGLGVIVKEALANGRLTARGGVPGWRRSRAGSRKAPTRWPWPAVLAQPWADVVLSGAGSAEQLTSNLGARELRWDDEAAEALAGLAEAPRLYWRTRSSWPGTDPPRRRAPPGLRRSRPEEE